MAGGGGGLFLFLGLDHVDAGFRQHRHRVLDLLGGHFVGRQGGVQFVIGDVAALLAFLDELLELGAECIEEGGIGAFFAGLGGFGLGCGRGFGRHYCSLGATNGSNGRYGREFGCKKGVRKGDPAKTTLLLYGG